jgi:hypothetical protein
MCGMKEAFVHIDESYKGNITFGDLSQRLVEGRGKILIELKNGEQKFIISFLCSRHEEQHS